MHDFELAAQPRGWHHDPYPHRKPLLGLALRARRRSGHIGLRFLLILIGVFMFRQSAVTRTRDLGRVGIGLGLMLIALQQLLSMITPYEDVPSLRMLLGAVTTDPMIDVLLAAALTWAAHSSVA